MSLSPSAATSNISDIPSKRRRTHSLIAQNSNNNLDHQDMSQSPADTAHSSQQPQGAAHIPKRGARACTACRKGKNRCEGEVRLFKTRLRSSPLCSLARLSRPGPALHSLGSLSSMSVEWNRLCVRETREEKYKCYNWRQCRVSFRSDELAPSSLTPLNRRLSRLEGQYLVHAQSLYFEVI